MEVILRNDLKIQVLNPGAKCSEGPDNDHRIHCGMSCPFLKRQDHEPENVMDRCIPQAICCLSNPPHPFKWKSGYSRHTFWETVRTETCCLLDPDPEIIDIRTRYAQRYGLGGEHPSLTR